MAESETKLARLVNWVRDNMDRKRSFVKSDLYSFARENGIERHALDFLYRCRKKQTIREIGPHRVVVLVQRGTSLKEFYKDLLKIQDEPVLQGRPMPPHPRKNESAGGKKKQPLNVAPFVNLVSKRSAVPDVADATFEHLERIDGLEQKGNGVTVAELEKRVHQLETQLEEFREKAEAFDLIKRDVWEVIQALDIVEAEREDVKKVLKKFLPRTTHR